MMVAEIETDQFSLFPIASLQDINNTKQLLTKYRKMKLVVKDFESHDQSHSTPQHRSAYEYCKRVTTSIERAIALIIDSEVKEIISFRIIDGHNRAQTVIRFSLMCDRSVDRKILEGIESIANTLKIFGGCL